MADLLGRIERLLEDAVEGTSRRVFHAQLQPVELAKAASRVLQAQQVVGTNGPEVPNSYRIALNPADFARFAGYRHSLEGRIVAYLDRFAEDRGLQPVADWRVMLVSDANVRSRAIVVDAEMADVEDERRRFTPDDRGDASVRLLEGATGEAVLVMQDGQRFPVQADQIAMGRALDNDVVIDDPRVSRYHATVFRTDRGYLLRDADSTNGTAIAGKRVTEQRLRDGDEISLGGYIVTVRLGAS